MLVDPLSTAPACGDCRYPAFAYMRTHTCTHANTPTPTHRHMHTCVSNACITTMTDREATMHHSVPLSPPLRGFWLVRLEAASFLANNSSLLTSLLSAVGCALHALLPSRLVASDSPDQRNQRTFRAIAANVTALHKPMLHPACLQGEEVANPADLGVCAVLVRMTLVHEY